MDEKSRENRSINSNPNRNPNTSYEPDRLFAFQTSANSLSTGRTSDCPIQTRQTVEVLTATTALLKSPVVASGRFTTEEIEYQRMTEWA